MFELNRDGFSASRYVRQETFGERHISSCIPTSILNAAVAIGAVSTAEALRIHRPVIDALTAVPDIWNGSFVRIGDTFDTRVADIMEQFIPARIGFDDPNLNRKTMFALKTFEQVYDKLTTGNETYAAINHQASHAVTIIGAVNGWLRYVDPLNPFVTKDGSFDWFNRSLSGTRLGLATLIPVRPKVIVVGHHRLVI